MNPLPLRRENGLRVKLNSVPGVLTVFDGHGDHIFRQPTSFSSSGSAERLAFREW